MPGKAWPTRVAWHFEVVCRKLAKDPATGKAIYKYSDLRTHSYVGKPSRYRALEARKFLRLVSPSRDTVLAESWQTEFDKEGLLAYKITSQGLTQAKVVSQAFFAYHPHSTEPEVVEGFTKPLYLKYIGGMRLYSQKRKLSQEAVEAYYNWYQEQFKKKLRRPKAVSSATLAGEVLENVEPQQ